MLLDPKAFRDTIDLFVERYKDQGITVVAGNVRYAIFFSPIRIVFYDSCFSYSLPWKTGVEARGFIFGPPIALAIGAKFVPLRKPKKLPGMSP